MTPEPLKILLVADNLKDVCFVQEMLRKVEAFPFHLTHMARLETALAHLAKPVAVVLLALPLLDEPGLKAISRIHSVHPQVPIVILCGLKDEAIAQQALQIGAQEYLVKEQTEAQLLVRVLRYAIDCQGWQKEIQQALQQLKQTEVALKESEAKFHRLSEASCEGIMVHERGIILDANQALASMFGCELSELIGKNAFELKLATPESLELIRQNILSNHEKPYEAVGLRKDGSAFPIEIQGKVIPDQGRLVRVSAIRDINERKRNEEKLSLYREIIANSNDAIAIINPQGYYLEQNAAHSLLIGYSDQELCGQTPAIHLGEQVFSLIAQTLFESGSYRGEAISRMKSGALLNLEISAFAVWDEVGKPVCYVGIKRDVTERQRAIYALTESDRLLAGVAAASHHLLTSKDFAAAMQLALSALGKACNVDRVYIFENHFHPDTGEPLLSQRFEWANSTVAAQIDNPELQNLPYSLLSPHWYSSVSVGKTVHGLVRDFPEVERAILEAQDIVSILLVPILLEGEFWGFMGFDDCHLERQWTETEQAILVAAAGSIGGAIIRKQTEVALQESEARFRTIFERSGIGIGVSALDGWLLQTNPALSRILGYSWEELLHMHFADYTHPDDLAIDLELFKQLADGQRNHYEMEKRFIHKDGQLVWGRLTVSLVTDSLGQPKFTIRMIEDITERKQTEKVLRDSKEAAEAGSRAKSEFLATMSHELRTPLNAILGLSQLLQQELFGALNAKQKEYINCIHSSGEHLLTLINDILDLSKVEAGKEELMCVPLNVQELCDDCLNIVRDRSLVKGLQLTSQVDPKADGCIADERRVKQMLLNLLTNAIKFTPSGKVSLQVEKVPQGIAFTVSDTGIGIDPCQIKLLFQPFKQLDSRLNRQYEGTGLGLVLTRSLARLHGGDVTVQSTLGEGSQFTLWLPDAPQELGVRGQGLEEKSPGCSDRILIVEDDDHSAILLQDYLKAIGYQVEHLTETKSFITRVRCFQPDLILLDLQLTDGVTGLDLLLDLRQQPDLHHLTVVVVTAMAGDREQFLAAGANDYLSKPIAIAQLESILMQYLN